MPAREQVTITLENTTAGFGMILDGDCKVAAFGAPSHPLSSILEHASAPPPPLASC